MAKRSYPLSKAYRLLEPAPVVRLVAAWRGRANVMPLSWHTLLEFEPPRVGCVIGGHNASFDAVRATRVCTLDISTAELANAVVGVGDCSGRTVDTFARSGLTPAPASVVAAPLIAECHANRECRVADTREMNRYNFFWLEVLKARVDMRVKEPKTLHHRGKGEFFVAGETLRLHSAMK